MRFRSYLLLAPPYLFVGCISFLALIMGGGIQGLANVLFAIVWMAIPYAIARAATKYFQKPNAFFTVWIISAWVFVFLWLPVGEALYFIGIDL